MPRVNDGEPAHLPEGRGRRGVKACEWRLIITTVEKYWSSFPIEFVLNQIFLPPGYGRFEGEMVDYLVKVVDSIF